MVITRPAPKPIMTNATVKTVHNSAIAQNISKLPPSVSIIQTPSANTTASPQASQQQPSSTTTTTTASKKVIECVDLSDDEDQAVPKAKPSSTTTTNGLRMVPVSQLRGNNAIIAPVKKLVPAGGFSTIPNLTNVAVVQNHVARHPAPLPNPPRMQTNGPLPPKPTLKLSRLQNGKIFFLFPLVI